MYQSLPISSLGLMFICLPLIWFFPRFAFQEELGQYTWIGIRRLRNYLSSTGYLAFQKNIKCKVYTGIIWIKRGIYYTNKSPHICCYNHISTVEPYTLHQVTLNPGKLQRIYNWTLNLIYGVRYFMLRTPHYVRFRATNSTLGIVTYGM